jgi:ABC-type antimicrobial peptide transport system permease subunit
MINLSIIAQILVAIAILIIWVFRFYNVEKEFRSYGLSDLTRNMVGAAKIALSTLLIAGIWYQDLLFASSLAMASLMLAAQYFHFKAKHPWLYFVLSFILLVLCLFIAAVSKNLI